jgi:hypothetical protein
MLIGFKAGVRLAAREVRVVGDDGSGMVESLTHTEGG